MPLPLCVVVLVTTLWETSIILDSLGGALDDWGALLARGTWYVVFGMPFFALGWPFAYPQRTYSRSWDVIGVLAALALCFIAYEQRQWGIRE